MVGSSDLLGTGRSLQGPKGGGEGRQCGTLCWGVKAQGHEKGSLDIEGCSPGSICRFLGLLCPQDPHTFLREFLYFLLQMKPGSNRTWGRTGRGGMGSMYRGRGVSLRWEVGGRGREGSPGKPTSSCVTGSLAPGDRPQGPPSTRGLSPGSPHQHPGASPPRRVC